jgi:hypothetical protein
LSVLLAIAELEEAIANPRPRRRAVRHESRDVGREPKKVFGVTMKSERTESSMTERRLRHTPMIATKVISANPIIKRGCRGGGAAGCAWRSRASTLRHPNRAGAS